MIKRHTRQKRQKRQKRQRRRTMKGGAFTQQELQQLESTGFTDYEIESLTNLGVSFNEVMQKIDTIMNEGPNGFVGNPDSMIEQVVNELLNEHIDNIPYADDDPHYLDTSQGSLHLSDLDISQPSQGSLHLSDLDTSQPSQGSLHLSDLDTSQPSQGSLHLSDLDTSNMSGYTTSESYDNFGGRRRKKTTKKRRGKKSRKTRKQKGGMCFGNGVGANSSDPNYSIYNTNILKLFPYRP